MNKAFPPGFIIPAIDIIDGQCVRLTQGAYDRKKVYDDDPLAVAKRFEQEGAQRLHVVDLDGAREGRLVNTQVLERIVAGTSLKVDAGGGMKSRNDVQRALDAGVEQVTGGSVAVKDPDEFKSWLRMFGPERIILGADVRDGSVAVSGWQQDGGVSLMDFLEQWVPEGIEHCICTDITRDGMLEGPNTELYAKILKRFPDLNLIASGGVATVDDLKRSQEIGVRGVIVGKAFYEGNVPLSVLNLKASSEE